MVGFVHCILFKFHLVKEKEKAAKTCNIELFHIYTFLDIEFMLKFPFEMNCRFIQLQTLNELYSVSTINFIDQFHQRHDFLNIKYYKKSSRKSE